MNLSEAVCLECDARSYLGFRWEREASRGSLKKQRRVHSSLGEAVEKTKDKNECWQ